MKKLVLTLAFFAGLMMQALAYDFVSENLLYSIISTDPPCVSLDGHIDGQAAQGELIIPETVENDGVVYTVTEIGDLAFYRCIYLTGDLVIPETVTRIGIKSFLMCGIPGTLTIPNSVTEIGKYAFCSNRLTGSLILPDSLSVIEAGTFSGSEGFTGDLVIPESVITIHDSAFRLCSFDGHLIMGEGVISIGMGAFYQCTGLKGDLVIPESVVDIGPQAFYKCSGFNGTLTLPSELTKIEDMTFAWCSGLTGSLTIPENVTFIGDQAFADCGFTGELVIPNAVTRIKKEAFALCSHLNSLTIGGAVDTIGYIACAGIPLESIKIHAETPPVLHYLSFSNVPKDIPVYVPCHTLELFQNADYWNEFTNITEDCSLYVNTFDTEESLVFCYPNPARDLVKVEGVEPTSVQLYNAFGQLVKTANGTKEIGMAGLPSGIYFLNITDSEGRKCMRKVVKE